jgi:hypothetical protein
MDTSVFTKPEVIGPGIWFKMHIQGARATTEELKQAFVTNINALCDNFKCKKCQPHFRKFIDTHSFQQYWNIYDAHGRDIGFFKWTWEMHNQVNRFLKKYEPTLEEAYDYYTDQDAGACFTCGGSEQKPENVSRAVPPILTLHLQKPTEIPAKPFRLVTRNDKH